MPKAIKPSNHLRMFAGFRLTTFSAATNFGRTDSFLLPLQKRRNDGDGFERLLPVCFEQ